MRSDGVKCERMVVRTLRMPSKDVGEQDAVWARMLATIGGHVGRTVSKCIVRPEGETASDVFPKQLATAIEKLKGTAWLDGAAALQHLLERGATRVADATPGLVRTRKGRYTPAHNDAKVPVLFEVRTLPQQSARVVWNSPSAPRVPADCASTPCFVRGSGRRDAC